MDRGKATSMEFDSNASCSNHESSLEIEENNSTSTTYSGIQRRRTNIFALPSSSMNNENNACSSYGWQRRPQARGMEDQHLPFNSIARIMRHAVPVSANISNESKRYVQLLVTEFIRFIIRKTNDRCLQQQRRTINADDILETLTHLGFLDYVRPLTLYLNRYQQFVNRPGNSINYHVTQPQVLPLVTGHPQVAQPVQQRPLQQPQLLPSVAAHPQVAQLVQQRTLPESQVLPSLTVHPQVAQPVLRLRPPVPWSAPQPRVAQPMLQPPLEWSVPQPQLAQPVLQPSLAWFLPQQQVAQPVQQPASAWFLPQQQVAQPVHQPPLAWFTPQPQVAQLVQQPPLAWFMPQPQVAQPVLQPPLVSLMPQMAQPVHHPPLAWFTPQTQVAQPAPQQTMAWVMPSTMHVPAPAQGPVNPATEDNNSDSDNFVSSMLHDPDDHEQTLFC